MTREALEMFHVTFIYIGDRVWNVELKVFRTWWEVVFTQVIITKDKHKLIILYYLQHGLNRGRGGVKELAEQLVLQYTYIYIYVWTLKYTFSKKATSMKNVYLFSKMYINTALPKYIFILWLCSLKIFKFNLEYYLW